MFKNIIFYYFTIITFIYSSLACSTVEFSFNGDATSFGGSNIGGCCGFKENSFLYSNKLEVALNAQQWNNSLNCGRCVSIKYKDHAPITAVISDKCPECKFGDLDLFTESYSALIKSDPGRELITWSFVPCNEFVQGNIRLRIDNINQYWLSMNPENFLCGINAIEILFDSEWIKLERNDQTMNGLYFNYNGYVKLPFQLRLTSMYNEQLITQKYYDITNILSTDFQFNC